MKGTLKNTWSFHKNFPIVGAEETRFLDIYKRICANKPHTGKL